MSATIEQLEAAIGALETQRGLLGDAVVDAGTAPMREKLALMRSQTRIRSQQLKAVSVLFVDIVGSTAMSHDLDAEDTHVIIDGAPERFSAVVVAWKGRVLQYAGDSLLAAFGADEAQEDDAENSVHAGLAIVVEARRIAREIEATYKIAGFSVRVGINTGPVLLGGGVFDVAEEPAIVVKGMDEPLRSYIVQRAKPRAYRLERRGGKASSAAWSAATPS